MEANRGVYETGKKSFGKGADIGDKTLVDALKPCALALTKAAEEGKKLQEGIDLGAKAAHDGAEATKSHVATLGRAGTVGERSIGYPDAAASQDMAGRFLDGRLHSKTVPVLTAGDIAQMKEEVNAVAVRGNLTAYAVSIAQATRDKPELSCGASPRALLSMLRFAQASAFMRGRGYCVPEDIADAALLTLPHRLILASGARLGRITREEIVRSILRQIKVP